jgi:ABC-type transport system involved in cytochrome c biogenesis ATPase subunit
VLVAENVRAAGRHTPLVPPTSLRAERGELLLVRAASPLTRTGLALMLTGRMKPGEGAISWDGEGSRRALRRRSAVVDSPGVNAMESHMRVRDYASEMLSYLRPSPLRGTGVEAWLAEHGLEDLDDLWDEELTGEQRLRLACALAGADDAELLVFDTPSRHGEGSETPDAWLDRLLELAQDEDRPRAVVATVPGIPAGWSGPAVEVGSAPPPEADPEPEPEEDERAAEAAAEEAEDPDAARPGTSSPEPGADADPTSPRHAASRTQNPS